MSRGEKTLFQHLQCHMETQEKRRTRLINQGTRRKLEISPCSGSPLR